MTLTIDLTPTEARRVQGAWQKGINVAAIMKGVIAGLPEMPEAEASEDRTLALLAQWREEDDTDDLEELERRDADPEVLMTNLQANRLTLPVPEV